MPSFQPHFEKRVKQFASFRQSGRDTGWNWEESSIIEAAAKDGVRDVNQI
jgi:hypothetical protein